MKIRKWIMQKGGPAWTRLPNLNIAQALVPSCVIHTNGNPRTHG